MNGYNAKKQDNGMASFPSHGNELTDLKCQLTGFYMMRTMFSTKLTHYPIVFIDNFKQASVCFIAFIDNTEHDLFLMFSYTTLNKYLPVK